LVNRVRKSSSPALAALRESLQEDLIRDSDQTIKEQGIKHLTIKDIAHQASHHDIYVTAYAILSGAVHTTAQDLESHLDYYDRENAIQGFHYGPSDSNTEKFLGLAGLVMADAPETTASIFGEDRAQLCAEFTTQFQAALRERPAQER
jgi:hypothetical protein